MLIDKYKLLVFDLDGTLVHTTGEYRYFVVPETLKKLGRNPDVSLDFIDKFWFDGNRDKTILKYFKCDPRLFWKTFHKNDRLEERARYTHVYDDVISVLKSLKKMDKKLAITTGAPKKLAQMEIGLLPENYFEKIISIHSTRYKPKPDPQSLVGCLKFCKTKIIDAVYIGNSGEDIEYAKSAGVDSIYLERKEHSLNSKVKPQKIIHTLSQLLKNE